MNFGELKAFLKTIMTGDKAIPSDDELKNITSQVLNEIAIRCEPFSLISNNDEDDVIKVLNDEYFIRVPNKPISDNDKLDIDDKLVYAVCYLVASKIGKIENIRRYIYEADLIINNYLWDKYDNKDKELNNSYGYKKIYKTKVKTLRGYKYEWDERFVSILNDYLKGKRVKMLHSDRINIDKYLQYQANGLDDDEMYEALDRYLGGLNE